MYTDKQAIIMRRQRIWADLAYLEKAILRRESIFGSIPAHWKQARELLWRDLRATIALACTDSAQRLLGQVRRLTINGLEVEARIEKMLAGETPITRVHVVHAMRNLGKAPDAEIKVGSPTEPMDSLGYPSWTRMTRR